MSTCVCLHLTYLCQHTLSLLLILPVTLCVTPPAMHELSVIPAYTVCVCVCVRAHTHAYTEGCGYFPSHLRLLAQMQAFFLSSQLRFAISSPWKPVWGSNWQTDLHDFDYNFFFRVFALKFVCVFGSECSWVGLCCFCWFHSPRSFFLKRC